MAKFITTKLVYSQADENGNYHYKREKYLIEAVSFTEAEARMTAYARARCLDDFKVSTVHRSRISEVFFNAGGGSFWRVNIETKMLRRDGSAAVDREQHLVQADDAREAQDRFTEGFRDLTALPYDITGIAREDINDVLTRENGFNTPSAEESGQEGAEAL